MNDSSDSTGGGGGGCAGRFALATSDAKQRHRPGADQHLQCATSVERGVQVKAEPTVWCVIVVV